MSNYTENEVQNLEEDLEQEYKEYAYIVNNDNNSYSMLLLDDRDIMNTEFNDYTVEEGISLAILIIIWIALMISFIRWAFKWMKSY